MVSNLLTPPPNNLGCALVSVVWAAKRYKRCASRAASAHPNNANYTAQNASARRTGRRGASSSSAALRASARNADTPEKYTFSNHIFL